jgi:hypothetical protein
MGEFEIASTGYRVCFPSNTRTGCLCHGLSWYYFLHRYPIPRYPHLCLAVPMYLVMAQSHNKICAVIDLFVEKKNW